MIIGIIVSILLFSIIILIHELGHFFASRLFGVKVEEFGLGIPPRAKKIFTDKKGTLYSLNWLPLGGFVRLKGENSHILKDKKDKQALINKAFWKQSIIILSGVFMNFLLACIIFSILFFVGIKPIGINTKIDTDLNVKLIPTYQKAIESGILIKNKGILLNPVQGSIAEKSGIEKGDILYEINKIKINDVNQIIDIISLNAGKEINLTITSSQDISGNQKIQGKNSNFINTKEIKILIPESGKIGTYLGENIELNNDFKYKYGIKNSIKNGFIETTNQSLLTFKALKLLIKNIFNPTTPQDRTQAINEVSGPIGIVGFISSSIGEGAIFLLVLGAIISINLGVFNLLPIPALDGGRFFIILINNITSLILGKKTINEKTEGIIHLIFFVILIALSIIIAYNDIEKIIIN